MIAQLTGTAVQTTRNPMVIDVHGVGYAVHVPQPLLSSTPAGSAVTVLTHTYVREDALMLFGFSAHSELTLFQLLLSVSGIGPKTALSVMDRGVTAIHRAITSSDVAFFQEVPRLGKKNAQKIIIELKSKLGSTSELDLSDDGQLQGNELVDALLAMGFDRKEAAAAAKRTPSEGTLESRLKLALKAMNT